MEFVFFHAVVGADETTWYMLNKEEQKKHDTNKTWQVWTLAVPTAAYYEIKDSRSFDAAAELLGDFKGIILCDGYDVYPALAKRTADKVLAFCWSHVRRKYKDIEAFFPKETERILNLIDQLFGIERRAPGDTEEALAERARLRNEYSRPVIAEIKQCREGSNPNGYSNFCVDEWNGRGYFAPEESEELFTHENKIGGPRVVLAVRCALRTCGCAHEDAWRNTCFK